MSKTNSLRTNSCYACGEPIPNLEGDGNGNFRVKCLRCTCATKFKPLIEAIDDWNNGATYYDDGNKFWDLMMGRG
jgi:hypothetical protein